MGLRVAGVHYVDGVAKNFKVKHRPVLGAGGYEDAGLSIVLGKKPGRYSITRGTHVGPTSFNRDAMITNKSSKILPGTSKQTFIRSGKRSGAKAPLGQRTIY